MNRNRETVLITLMIVISVLARLIGRNMIESNEKRETVVRNSHD